jgi:DNA-binding transcriptional regulator YhcF (GntR family)
MELVTSAPIRLKGSDIEQNIIQQIEGGHYPSGMQLPSVREMADEFGVNKNTIVRIYQSLERRGYLQVRRGSGTYVRSLETENRAGAAIASWQEQLAIALRMARTAGVDQEQVRHIVLENIHQVYGSTRQRMLFVECNQYDIDSLSSIIAKGVELPLQGVLITDFLAEPEKYIANFDFIITTFFHLNEIEPVVNAVDSHKLVAVHAMPTQDALLELARLQVPVLGVVADLPRAMDMMMHIVQTYQRTATLMSSSLEDSVRLQNLLDKADAIVVTQSRYPGLMAHHPQIPVVPISLTITQESIHHVQQHLAGVPHPA